MNHNKIALMALSAVNPVTYKTKRNFIDGGTGLSPFITRGILTLPQVRDAVLARYTENESSNLIFELAWREYWQREWKYRGDALYADIKREQAPLESDQMPKAVLEAATSIAALDAAIVKLQKTGYMHNHERMWLSGLICNIARTHWWQPSKWLYYHLLDGDVASNSLSWQWVAGTFSSKKYLPAQENINKYAYTKQKGTYLDRTYEELGAIEVPVELQLRGEIDLQWQAPVSDVLHIDPSKPTLLYHSFWLNKQWHAGLDANRIVVLEPSWFNEWPVAPHVTQFIVEAAREIPGMQIIVSNFEDVDLPVDAQYMEHPSIKHWKGDAQAMQLLFPDVPDRSYNSFMSFWKQCQKTSK